MRAIDVGPADLETVRRILREHAPGLEAWAFGSRVSWTARGTSDLDLALMTAEPLDIARMAALKAAFTESDLPFRVDIVEWASTSESFREVIESDHVVLTRKDEHLAQTSRSLDIVGGFDVVPLGDVASVRSGFAFRSSDWADTGIPVVKIANVKHGNLVMDGCSFVSPPVAAAAGEFNLQSADILIAMTGYIGDVAIVRSSDLPAVLNQRVGLFSIRDPSLLENQFLFYLLQHKAIQKQVRELGYGSAQPNVSPSLVHSINIPFPSLPEQRAIAHILGTLDDKIELNRRMNETLVAMARALFKSWFVDFGPTNAKIEGHSPYLDSETWALFPNRLDKSGTPEGWEASTIGQEVDVVGGSTPSTKRPDYWGGDICWATPKDLSVLRASVLLGTERRITPAGLSKISSGLLPPGTVLLSSRAPIGYLAVSQVPTAVNQGFVAMVCKRRLSNVFVWLWTQANMEAILQNANGSTFQEISKRNFRPISVTVPSEPVLAAFNSLTQPMLDRTIANEQESRTLAATRDLLLSKLMSGEIRVREADAIVRKVARA